MKMRDLIERLKLVDPSLDGEVMLSIDVKDGFPKSIIIGVRGAKQLLQMDFSVEAVGFNDPAFSNKPTRAS